MQTLVSLVELLVQVTSFADSVLQTLLLLETGQLKIREFRDIRWLATASPRKVIEFSMFALCLLIHKFWCNARVKLW